MTRPALTAVLLAALLTAVAGTLSCAGAVYLPAPIARSGGLYVPWTPQMRSQRADVLACVELDTAGRPPTLWVARERITDGTGMPYLAYYDHEIHAVVFDPMLTMDDFWRVFRHEMIHAAERRHGHGPVFRSAERCAFWPAP